MKCYIKLLVIGALFANIAFANESTDKTSRVIFQVAPISALAAGAYGDGSFTFGELKHHGDFGLGTFLGLDGEMIALDGKFYQMLEKGHIRQVNDNDKVPFAEVNFFIPTQNSVQLSPIENYQKLSNLLLNKFLAT